MRFVRCYSLSLVLRWTHWTFCVACEFWSLDYHYIALLFAVEWQPPPQPPPQFSFHFILKFFRSKHLLRKLPLIGRAVEPGEPFRPPWSTSAHFAYCYFVSSPSAVCFAARFAFLRRVAKCALSWRNRRVCCFFECGKRRLLCLCSRKFAEASDSLESDLQNLNLSGFFGCPLFRPHSCPHGYSRNISNSSRFVYFERRKAHSQFTAIDAGAAVRRTAFYRLISVQMHCLISGFVIRPLPWPILLSRNRRASDELY